MTDFEVTVLDGGSKVLLLSIYNFHWLDFEWNFAKLGKCPHESCQADHCLWFGQGGDVDENIFGLHRDLGVF